MLAELFKVFSSDSTITNIVGNRVFPHHLPQSNLTLPVLTYQLISNTHDYTLENAYGVARARVQVDCWGDTLATVESLAEAVRQTIQGAHGMMGSTYVHFIQLDDEQDMHELIEDSDKWLYRRTQDYLIKYCESVPTWEFDGT